MTRAARTRVTRSNWEASFIKAGLREIDRAVILAILMEGAAKVSDPDEHERLRRVGTKALGGTV